MYVCLNTNTIWGEDRVNLIHMYVLRWGFFCYYGFDFVTLLVCFLRFCCVTRCNIVYVLILANYYFAQ